VPPPRATLIALVTATSAIMTGCGADHTSDRQPSTVATPTPREPGTVPAPQPEEQMRIQITVGEQRFRATVADNATGRDLLDQLPVTVDMVDHGAVEKTGPLPSPLSLQGAPEGADPDVGDIGYYAPGNDLVLYYGDQSYYPGIVIVGRLHGDAAQRIADLEGAVTAVVRADDD
jgi:hypothetical protein